jgi:hypothetical protein
MFFINYTARSYIQHSRIFHDVSSYEIVSFQYTASALTVPTLRAPCRDYSRAGVCLVVANGASMPEGRGFDSHRP